ncbi:hypothetical protein BC829DRAFT_421816 [Chytridium lagenaria]|nr:hypothetical protein BC829DRAFT_421816 [Chytridium lagenaria]
MDVPPPPPTPFGRSYHGVLISVLPYSTLKVIATAVGMPRPCPKGLVTMPPRIMTALSAIIPRPAVDPATNLPAFVTPVIDPPNVNGDQGHQGNGQNGNNDNNNQRQWWSRG